MAASPAKANGPGIEPPLPTTPPIGIVSKKPLEYLLTRGEYIGKGVAGKVYAYTLNNQMQIAAKFTVMEDMHHVGSIIREMGYLRRLQGHPNVLQLVDAACYSGAIVLVTPRAMGNLISVWKQMQDNQRIQCMLDVLYGLEYLHKHGVVHSDVKPGNILVYQDAPNQFRGVVSDFGTAMDDKKCYEKGGTPKDRGHTPVYRSPESYLERRSTIASDIWSFGISLYVVVAGKSLFKSAAKNKTIGDVASIVFAQQSIIFGEPTEETWKNVTHSHGWQKWLNNKNAALQSAETQAIKKLGSWQRYKIDKLAHNLLFRMLAMNPTKRASATQLISDPFFDPFRRTPNTTPSSTPNITCEEASQEEAISRQNINYDSVIPLLSKPEPNSFNRRTWHFTAQIMEGMVNRIPSITNETILRLSMLVASFFLERVAKIKFLNMQRKELEQLPLFLSHLSLDLLLPNTPFDLLYAAYRSHPYTRNTFDIGALTLKLIVTQPTSYTLPSLTKSRMALFIASVATKKKYVTSSNKVDDLVDGLLILATDLQTTQNHLIEHLKVILPALRMIPLGL